MDAAGGTAAARAAGTPRAQARPAGRCATEDGLHRGEQHAVWVASYGPAPKPSVPNEFASVATYWTAAFDKCVEKFEDEDHDWPSA